MKNPFRKSVVAAALVLAAASLTALPARADMDAKPGKARHEYCGGEKHRDGYGLDRTTRGRWTETLTGEQKTEITHLRVSLKKELAPVEAAIGLKRSEVNAILTSDRPDRAALGRLVEEISALRKDMLRSKYEQMIKVRGLLTAGQRAEFDMAVMSEKGHGREDRR